MANVREVKGPKEYLCGGVEVEKGTGPGIRWFWYGWKDAIIEMARSSSLGRHLKWDPISFANVKIGCD